MNIRFFFVADKTKNQEVKTTHCPTKEMVADQSTKTTQGSLFKYQRNLIQGVKKEDFSEHKEWCKEALEGYDLWDEDESGLSEL